MSDQATYIQKHYGNMKADESSKVKRQCMKFFDSAEWAMKSNSQKNMSTVDSRPIVSDELIEKFKQRYENVENQSSPLTEADA